MNGKPWTPEEDAILRKLYPRQPASHLERVLDRSAISIRNHAKKLGVSRSYIRPILAPETEAEPAELVKLRQQLDTLRSKVPTSPGPLPADHPEFIAYHRAMTAYFSEKGRIEGQITRLLCPVDLSTRTFIVLPAPPQMPPRLRR